MLLVLHPIHYCALPGQVFVYVPVCFLYIIPMQLFGSSITPEQTKIPKYKFAIMGCLDSISGIMSTFSLNYIPNASLVVLLGQASIPIAMIISKVSERASLVIEDCGV